MIFPKAKKIAKELGWYKTNDGVFGLYKGYFFNVSDASLVSNPQFKFVTVTIDNTTSEQKTQLKIELDNNKKNLKFTKFEINDNRIYFQFAENLTYTKIKTVYSLFDFLVNTFKKLNVSEQNKCHQCGTQKEINYYNLNDSGIILCKSCFKQTENNFNQIEREKISNEKNYLTGFLGSMVFSIPVIIAWVLLAVYIERIASGMAFILAFLGLKGYDFFKGRHGKLRKYILFLTNVVSILVANVLTVLVLMVKEGLTINQSLMEFQINQIAKNIFYQNIIISFILALLAWVWILFIMKDDKLTITLADKFEK